MEHNTHVKKFSLAATRSNDPIAVVRESVGFLRSDVKLGADLTRLRGQGVESLDSFHLCVSSVGRR